MNLSKTIVFLLLTSVLFGKEPVEHRPVRYSKEPVIEHIRGLLLIPNQDYVTYTNTRGVCGLEVHDLCVPGDLDCLKETLEPLFMNQPLSQELLRQIKEEIILFYRQNGRPVVSVYVPQQEITCGVLQMVVIEACVGQVCTSGNCYFADWLYTSFLRLRPGYAITSDALMTDVSWLNRNPFRNVDVVFTPGCDPCTTNIELVVCDRFPLQFYVGGDNAGTDLSSEGRLYAGATWGNAFFLDHILTYQYTTSPDGKEFQSHTGHYTAPLPWHHLFLLYGGYSVVKPEIRDFESSGSASQASLRYVIPFGCNYEGHLQEWSAGFDFKNYNNNLIFTSSEELAIITKTVNLSQFVMGYAFAFNDCCQRFSFNLDLYGSPGKLLPNESDERYDELSPNAQVRYIYGRLTVGDVWNLWWDFGFSALGRLQVASHNLLPSERFGIGGYDTVRGYEEREFLADNALVLNAELNTPPVSVLQFFGGCPDDDQMLFLVFFDYGIGALTDRNRPSRLIFNGPNIGKTEYLMSTGVGWRYTINRYFSARVDWGVKLHHSFFSDKQRSRFHAGVVLSY